MGASELPAWVQPVSVLLERHGYPMVVNFVLLIFMWKFNSKLSINQEKTLTLVEKILTKLNMDKED